MTISTAELSLPTTCNRCLKEWAIAVDALRNGEMCALLRKGGIREEDGIFRVDDSYFLLMPTYEHQKISQLKPEYSQRLSNHEFSPYVRDEIRLDTFAVVEMVKPVKQDSDIFAIRGEHIWNEDYEKLRLDFNPYDPLYIILLRAYKLSKPVTIPMRPEFGGCKSCRGACWKGQDRYGGGQEGAGGQLRRAADRRQVGHVQDHHARGHSPRN